MADLHFWLVDASLSSVFVVPLLLSSELVADQVYAALHDTIGDSMPVLTAGVGATLLFTLVVVLASDLSFFFSHRVRHRVPRRRKG